jgi:hypothetical protein
MRRDLSGEDFRAYPKSRHMLAWEMRGKAASLFMASQDIHLKHVHGRADKEEPSCTKVFGQT